LLKSYPIKKFKRWAKLVSTLISRLIASFASKRKKDTAKLQGLI